MPRGRHDWSNPLLLQTSNGRNDNHSNIGGYSLSDRAVILGKFGAGSLGHCVTARPAKDAEPSPCSSNAATAWVRMPELTGAAT